MRLCFFDRPIGFDGQVQQRGRSDIDCRGRSRASSLTVEELETIVARDEEPNDRREEFERDCERIRIFAGRMRAFWARGGR